MKSILQAGLILLLWILLISVLIKCYLRQTEQIWFQPLCLINQSDHGVAYSHESSQEAKRVYDEVWGENSSQIPHMPRWIYQDCMIYKNGRQSKLSVPHLQRKPTASIDPSGHSTSHLEAKETDVNMMILT